MRMDDDSELAEADFRRTAHKLGLTSAQLQAAEAEYDRNYPPTDPEPEKNFTVETARALGSAPTKAVRHLVRVRSHQGPDPSALCGLVARRGFAVRVRHPERECGPCYSHADAVDVIGSADG